MKSILKLMLGASIGLLVLALPLIIWLDLESYFLDQLNPETSSLSRIQVGWVVFFVLAIDIFAPVPSSGVMTFCGAWFGNQLLETWPAVLICFAGLTVSVLAGYGAARFLGHRFVIHWTRPEDLASATHWLQRFGISWLILLRCVPVLGEASVLVAGACGMDFRKVLFATSLANFLYTTTFVVVGYYAGQSDWLPLVIVIALLLPLFGLFLLRGLAKRSRAAAG